MKTRLVGRYLGESVTGLIFWSSVVLFGMGGRLWRKCFHRQGEAWSALIQFPPELQKHGNQGERAQAVGSRT